MAALARGDESGGGILVRSLSSAALRSQAFSRAGPGLEIARFSTRRLDLAEPSSSEADRNAPYLKLMAKGRPYVHAKWAMTLDGKIATRTGDSKWISNKASRRWVHELRGRVDADSGDGVCVARHGFEQRSGVLLIEFLLAQLLC